MDYLSNVYRGLLHKQYIKYPHDNANGECEFKPIKVFHILFPLVQLAQTLRNLQPLYSVEHTTMESG